MKIGNIDIADIKLGDSQVSAWFGGVLVWGGGSPTPPTPTGDWLCFTAVQDNSTVKLAKYGTPPAVSLETSTDGETWADYTINSTLTLASIGDKVYFRAKTENSSMASSWNKYNYFVMSGKIAASGNIQSLLKSDCSRTDVPIYGYSNLFYNCASLVTPPELPSTTLNERSYNAMFYKCSSLSVAPALPATTLYDRTYNGMFEDCTSLSAAPELPATTLSSNCYENLFKGCSSLTNAPALPATTLASGCYKNMFNGCTSLTTAPALPATTLADSCYQSMFQGCSNIASIDVSFSAWNPTNATTNWVTNVAASGTFTCPAALGDDSTITRGTSNCPSGWTVVNT